MRLTAISAAATCLALQILAGGAAGQTVLPAADYATSTNRDPELTSLAAEVDAIHAELADLRGAAYSEPCGSEEHFCDCCYAPGWHAGAELAILRPNFGGGILVQAADVGVSDQAQPEFDYDASARVFLGYRGPSQLGIRTRYWRFDHSAPTLGELSSGLRTASLDVQALDLEITKVLYTSGVHWDLGAGLRYAKVESFQGFRLDEPISDLDIFAIESVDFEGLGPTFAIEGRHQIGGTNLSLIGNLRASLLHGDQKGVKQGGEVEDPEDPLVGSFSDKVIPILETQFGIEWGIPLQRGRFFVRTMLEGQWWGDAVTPGRPDEQAILEQLRTENLGLFGGTFSAAYVW